MKAVNDNFSPTIHLAQELIQCPSVTPLDAGCQDILIARLINLGFTVTSINSGEVHNFWAIRGDTAPIFAFAGHTDVVPTGPLGSWNSPPFSATINEGFLYGRGAADMKGGIAAMVTACERFIAQYPNHAGSIAFIITSDEEGPAIDGTQKVIQYLIDQNIHLSYCIVGEPSSREALGDTLKVGRRGSLSGTLTVHGVQGHIAYPHKAINPIHLSLEPLATLISQQWDTGNDYFPPTSFQISNITAGTGVGNVIPGLLECRFNFRFSTEHTAESLTLQVHQILDSYSLPYDIQWERPSQPFLTPHGALLKACTNAIREHLNIGTQLSTDGGTSDGRFIAPLGVEVVELGPCNSTIHSVNECVTIQELNQLSILYESVLKELL
jgi:succinyl-diaminopimelate desuccinylase